MLKILLRATSSAIQSKVNPYPNRPVKQAKIPSWDVFRIPFQLLNDGYMKLAIMAWSRTLFHFESLGVSIMP
jgi:hypothetical protein